MLVIKLGKECIVNEQLNFNHIENNNEGLNKYHSTINNPNNQTDNTIKAVPKFKLTDKLTFINEKIRTLSEKKDSLNKITTKYFSINNWLDDIKKDIEQIENSLNENKNEISSEKKKFNDIILEIENVNKDDAKKVINANNNQEGKGIDESILNYIKNHKQTFMAKIN